MVCVSNQLRHLFGGSRINRDLRNPIMITPDERPVRAAIHPSSRCRLCPGKNKCIAPDGPQQRGGLLFIGEAPGKNEDAKDRVFIGKTGEEVNEHYLPLAGLRRKDVTFTNAIACLPISAGGKLDPNRTADKDLLQCCAETHLYPLIERMQPRCIIPLGRFACDAVLPGLDLELLHGIPQESPWGIPAFPMYHPALGLHEPKKMLHVRTDWDRLRKFLNGTLYLPVDPHPEPDYQEVEYEREIHEIDPTLPLGADTESSREGPFCFTYSQQPGTGRLIRADRADLVKALDHKLSSWEDHILFHNWPYDWSVTEDMGLHLPYRRVVDTMELIYHLGNFPQGLKALARRLLGMVMMDFDDVVTPHSAKRVVEYYRMAYAEDWPKPDAQQVRDEETGGWKLYKPQSMKTKLSTFFTYLKKNPNKDVFEAWDNWEDSHEMIETVMGPWPGKDIRHAAVADWPSVLRYASRDPDATLRLYLLVKKMAPLVRRFDQNLWLEKAAQHA